MVNRDELLDEYVGEVINGLDLDVIYTYAFDALRRDMEALTTEELLKEVTDYYPHLLEK